jgi:hypothetical protein
VTPLEPLNPLTPVAPLAPETPFADEGLEWEVADTIIPRIVKAKKIPTTINTAFPPPVRGFLFALAELCTGPFVGGSENETFGVLTKDCELQNGQMLSPSSTTCPLKQITTNSSKVSVRDSSVRDTVQSQLAGWEEPRSASSRKQSWASEFEPDASNWALAKWL